MAVETDDRRTMPRVGVALAGELATGNCLVQIKILDLSAAGCGIEILEQIVPDVNRFGETGILNLKASTADTDTMALPVMISHGRIEGGKLRFGLKFRQMSPYQSGRFGAVFESFLDRAGP